MKLSLDHLRAVRPLDDATHVGLEWLVAELGVAGAAVTLDVGVGVVGRARARRRLQPATRRLIEVGVRRMIDEAEKQAEQASRTG